MKSREGEKRHTCWRLLAKSLSVLPPQIVAAVVLQLRPRTRGERLGLVSIVVLGGASTVDRMVTLSSVVVVGDRRVDDFARKQGSFAFQAGHVVAVVVAVGQPLRVPDL